MPRETGSEKSDQSCPTCGGSMQVTESDYGSLTASCVKCNQSSPVETEKAAQTPAREIGTDVNEESTDA